MDPKPSEKDSDSDKKIKMKCHFCVQEKDELPCPLHYCLKCKYAAPTLVELRNACSCDEEEYSPLPGKICKECADVKLNLVQLACRCCDCKMTRRSIVTLCVKCKSYNCRKSMSCEFCSQCEETQEECTCKKSQRIGLCRQCVVQEMKDTVFTYYDKNYTVKAEVRFI